MDTAEEKKEVEEFLLDLLEEPITLNFKGEKKNYIVRELDGNDRDAYLTGMFSRMKIGADGKSTLQSATGLQASLLNKAIFDDDGKPVPAAVIQKWPARVIKKLFEKVQKMSGLNATAEKDAKNDSDEETQEPG